MPSGQNTSLSPNELAFLHESLSHHPPIRPDARSPTTFRPLIAELNLLPSANGSARMCFADGTESIVAVKAEIERTERGGDWQQGKEVENDGAADFRSPVSEWQREDISWIEVAVDVPGIREEDAVIGSFSHMIHETLTLDKALLRRLFVNQDWHWKIYIDIVLLSLSASHPLPLLSLATHLALCSTRLPALISQGREDPLFNDDWEASVPLYPQHQHDARDQLPDQIRKPPISIVVISVGSNLFFDPTSEELAVAEAVVALTFTLASGGNESDSIRILAIRSLPLPISATGASSATLGGPTSSEETARTYGVWKPKRGGMKRDTISKMIYLCTKKQGVGEELLQGLIAFI